MDSILHKFVCGDALRDDGGDAGLQHYMAAVVAKRPVAPEQEARYLRMLLVQQSATRASLLKERTCVLCRAVYTEAGNLAQWHCRRHMMAWDPVTALWPCCAVRFSNAAGCMRSDHVDSDSCPASLAIWVPAALQPIITKAPLAAAVVPVGDGGAIQSHYVATRLLDASDPMARNLDYVAATSVLYARTNYLQTLHATADVRKRVEQLSKY